MDYDIIIGLLIGLAATCMGGLFAMLTMYWISERDQGPPRRGRDEPAPPPPIGPSEEIPDFVPQDWIDQAA
jgi:hypothetical protein